MRKFLTVIVATIFIASLSSCGGSGSRSTKEDLQGKWEITTAIGSSSAMNIGTIYTFTDDQMSTGIAEGKFTATDSTILWNVGEIEMNYNYHFDGEFLIIEPNGSGQIFTLEYK